MTTVDSQSMSGNQGIVREVCLDRFELSESAAEGWSVDQDERGRVGEGWEWFLSCNEGERLSALPGQHQ